MERDGGDDVSKNYDSKSTKNISTHTNLQEGLGAWMVALKASKTARPTNDVV